MRFAGGGIPISDRNFRGRKILRSKILSTRTIAEKWGHVPTLHPETQNANRMDITRHLDILAPCPLYYLKPKTQQNGHVTPFFRNCMRAHAPQHADARHSVWGPLRVVAMLQHVGHSGFRRDFRFENIVAAKIFRKFGSGIR